MADFVIKAKALNVDIVFEQGATFDAVITYKDSLDAPIDNTGWTAQMEIRHADTNAVLETFTHLDGLVLGGADGTITFNVIASRINAYLLDDFGGSIYDLFVNTGTKDIKLIFGGTSVIDRVTEVP